MPYFWREWMPHLATFTYMVDSLLSTSIGGGKEIVCRASEFAVIQPSSGTCQEFLGPYIAANGGYVDNGDATSDCRFCQYRTGDQYLTTVGYVSLAGHFSLCKLLSSLFCTSQSWSHRPQNIGYIIAYVAFNVRILFTFFFPVLQLWANVFRRLFCFIRCITCSESEVLARRPTIRKVPLHL